MHADARTDEELLNAARNGDESALAVLFERHRNRLERMRPRRALRARIDVKATSLANQVFTHEVKVKLPGRDRSRPGQIARK